MSIEATEPSDHGIICEACEHFNPQHTEFCDSCGFQFSSADVLPMEPDSDDGIDLSVVKCPLREEDIDPIRETLSRIPDPGKWFPGSLHWNEAGNAIEQHLPQGFKRSRGEPLPPITTLESVAEWVHQLHGDGFRVNSLHLGGLVLDEQDRCVGLCLPPSLSRLDQSAKETPLSGLNCCFAAPEVQQFTDAQAGPASDVFSLAALFYYLHSGATPVDLCSVRFELPLDRDVFTPALASCLRKALSLDPDDRPQSASDLIAELTAAARLDRARLDFNPTGTYRGGPAGSSSTRFQSDRRRAHRHRIGRT